MDKTSKKQKDDKSSKGGAKGGSFLDGIFGSKGKKGSDESELNPLKALGASSGLGGKQAERQAERPVERQAVGNAGNAANNGWQQKQENRYAGVSNQNQYSNPENYNANYGGMNSAPSDATMIDEVGASDPNTLYLSLYEPAIGYNCPPLIQLELVNGVATIGRRDKEGNAQTNYGFDSSLSFISRMHARVEKNNGAWQIIDLDSKGGTFLNGQRLVPNMAYTMNPGDIVMFTSKHLCYRITQS